MDQMFHLRFTFWTMKWAWFYFPHELMDKMEKFNINLPYLFIHRSKSIFSSHGFEFPALPKMVGIQWLHNVMNFMKKKKKNNDDDDDDEKRK